MDEEKLITVVRHYEFLYDTAHPKYMDGAKKEAAWSEISHLLNQPASACKHKWQSLRDAYRRAINKRKSRVGQPMAKIKKWKFEDEISFLSKYLCERKKTLPADEDNHDNQNDVDDENVSNSDFEVHSESFKHEKEEFEYSHTYSIPTDSTLFAATTSPITSSNVQKNSQKWITSQPSPSYVTSSYTEELNKEHKETEVTQDQMDLFFLNISNTVKSFSPYLQAIAKNKIFNLVSELEIQQLAPTKSNISVPQTVIPQAPNWPTPQQQNSSHVYIKVENPTEIN